MIEMVELISCFNDFRFLVVPEGVKEADVGQDLKRRR